MSSAAPATLWTQSDLLGWRPSAILETQSRGSLKFFLSDPERPTVDFIQKIFKENIPANYIYRQRLSARAQRLKGRRQSLGSLNSFFSHPDNSSHRGGGCWLNFGQGCAAYSFRMVPLARLIFVKMIPLARLNIDMFLVRFISKPFELACISKLLV